jgi:succinate dehydrogenase / fumarate reductase cytochrome b subunit
MRYGAIILFRSPRASNPSTDLMANATTRKPRPKYLSLSALLFEIRLPLPGWVSILHRISGLLLFFAVLWLLFLLDRSLASEAGFESVRRYAGLPLVKISLLVLVWAYSHHFCAGIRFLFLDLDKGGELGAARRTSVLVFVVSLALTAWLGWMLW